MNSPSLISTNSAMHLPHSSHVEGDLSLVGPFKVSSVFKSLLIFFLVIGIVTFLSGLFIYPERAWVSFLASHFYFLCIALGGIFFAAIQWITGAMWSATTRRLMESFSAYLPWLALPFIILMQGIPTLYSWSHPENVQGDLVLEGKTSYLNVTFFMVRNLIAIALWAFLALKMVRNSTAQDQDGEMKWTLKNRVLSPIFFIIFAISFTMTAFDLIMSLDAHWFSTIFGVYCFSGLINSFLAAFCLLTLYFLKRGNLQGFVNENHLHDIGKFMFGFTVFWAYIGFSQFMLIWYANLPEEITFYLLRFQNHWKWVSILLLVSKFILPFFILLPRHAKRCPKILTFAACLMLFAQGVDIVWLIQPEFFSDGPIISWVEIGIFLGFLGGFGLSVSCFLSRHNLIAMRDPRLPEALHHHQ